MTPRAYSIDPRGMIDTTMTTEERRAALEHGPLYSFSEWASFVVPPGAGVYTIWDDEGRFIYVGMSGRGLTRDDVAAMKESGGGSIINMSSTAALVGLSPYFAYSAAKGGIRSLTKSVAHYCRERQNGVRCNSVHPGSIDTPMVEAALAGLQEHSGTLVTVERGGVVLFVALVRAVERGVVEVDLDVVTHLFDVGVEDGHGVIAVTAHEGGQGEEGECGKCAHGVSPVQVALHCYMGPEISANN